MNDQIDADRTDESDLKEEDLEPLDLGAVTEETHGGFLGAIFDGSGGRWPG